MSKTTPPRLMSATRIGIRRDYKSSRRRCPDPGTHGQRTGRIIRKTRSNSWQGPCAKGVIMKLTSFGLTAALLTTLTAVPAFAQERDAKRRESARAEQN